MHANPHPVPRQRPQPSPVRNPIPSPDKVFETSSRLFSSEGLIHLSGGVAGNRKAPVYIFVEPEIKPRPIDDQLPSLADGSIPYLTNKDGDPSALSDYIYLIVLSLGFSTEFAEGVTGPKYIRAWKRVFTHESFDSERNYEQPETIGDTYLATAFIDIMMDQYPNLTPRQFTVNKSHYMSTVYQSYLGKILALDRAIVLGKNYRPPYARNMPPGAAIPRVEHTIVEDVFEAFMGTLARVSSHLYNSKGAGFDVVRRCLSILFGKIPLVEHQTPLDALSKKYDVLSSIMGLTGAPKAVPKLIHTPEGYGDNPENRTRMVFLISLVENVNGTPNTIVSIIGDKNNEALMKIELGKLGLTILEQRGYSSDFIEKERLKRDDKQVRVRQEGTRLHGLLRSFSQYRGAIGHTFDNMTSFVDRSGNLMVKIELNLRWKNGYTHLESGTGPDRISAELDALVRCNRMLSDARRRQQQ